MHNKIDSNTIKLRYLIQIQIEIFIPLIVLGIFSGSKPLKMTNLFRFAHSSVNQIPNTKTEKRDGKFP